MNYVVNNVLFDRIPIISHLAMHGDIDLDPGAFTHHTEIIAGRPCIFLPKPLSQVLTSITLARSRHLHHAAIWMYDLQTPFTRFPERLRDVIHEID